MKINRLTPIVLAVALVVCIFFSCDEDNPGNGGSVDVKNTELKAVLQQKGFTFDAEGKLVQDDKVKNTTSLDLSGTKIADLSGLDIFPNLTEVDLSDNEYKMSFDFSVLPKQITGVDLTGNELYEFPGLLTIEIAENGDETITVLRKLTKLYLPESAKYNCKEIPTFYAQKKEADMKMEDAKGTLVAYNTLREVPDEVFRSILKVTFPSMFVGDKIDISKRLVALNEITQGISTVDPDPKGDYRVDNVDGFQYILANRGYKGTVIYLNAFDICTVPYFPVNSTINNITLLYINTPNGVNMDRAARLNYFQIEHNPGIEAIDLSGSTTFGQRGDDVEKLYTSSPSRVSIRNCEKVKTIKFPAAAKALQSLEIVNCPSMKKVDLSQFETMYSLSLGLLPSSCEVTYFTLKRLLHNWMLFAIDGVMYNKAETKAFLDTYHEQLEYTSIPGYRKESYHWYEHYK